ncbi:unnamed protein product [Fusarium venenatum]|uniref:Uncharacterized protein n=1 Tax=Fusarium venenatum TaxID=56646 RepID=A0A2L2SR45_9HYPO|nr:uncharacterized protein FVRRES_13357 [Fusarium venenatum]CEI40961.1 unnamed protein product [Fusarium venenatum]
MELVKWVKPGNGGVEAEDADRRRSSIVQEKSVCHNGDVMAGAMD